MAMASGKRFSSKCVFCGRRGKLSKDHVPPKCLFPKGSRSGLITVPACPQCNLSSSGDDEYLRLVLVTNRDSEVHPAVRSLRPTVLRSLIKPTKRGFAAAFWSSIRDLDIFSPGGIYLCTAKGFQMDSDRVHRIVAKIVQGLFWYEYEQRLLDSHRVVAVSIGALRQHVPDSDLRAWTDRIRGLMVGGKSREVGNRVLVYYCNQDPESCFRTVWGLTFFGNIHFAAFTASKPGLQKVGEPPPHS